MSILISDCQATPSSIQAASRARLRGCSFGTAIAAGVVAFVGATAAAAAATEQLCIEDPRAGIERPPRDQSPCESLGATLRAVGAAFFQDCSPSNPALSQKYSEMAARYAGMPPNIGLPLMTAEFTAELGKDGTRCAIRAVVQEGLPFSAETRDQLVALLNGIFELRDIQELIDDIDASGPRTAMAKREELSAKLQKEMNDRVEAHADLKQSTSAFESLQAKAYTAVVGLETQARAALDATDQALVGCAIEESQAKLAEAVGAGRQGLADTLHEIRASERAAECWEGRLRQQYGADWNLRTAVIAGPSLTEYTKARDSIARLERAETSFIETLERSGASCRRLKQQVDIQQRMLGHYAEAQSRAATALAAGPCDLSAAEEALATLRNLEGGTCGDRLGTPVSGDIEARIAARKAERRTTEACADASGGGAQAFAGAWQCPVRGTITFQVDKDAVTGSVAGRPGEHWGAGQRAGGKITGTVTDRTLQLVMESGDGTVSRLSATLAIDGRSFSGPWEWFRGETKLDSGTWSCQRPPG